MTRSRFRDPELVRKEIAGVNWYHQIDLGDGIVTPGVDTANRMAPLDAGRSPRQERARHRRVGRLPSRPTGSEQVLATSYCWNGEGWGRRVRHRETHPGLRVEDFEIDVMDLSPERVGTFDVVLFVGVLTTCDTLLALERVASVSADLLVFDSHTAMSEERRPVMLFYPGTEQRRPDQLVGPNPPVVEAMLRDVGFRQVDRKHPELIPQGRLIHARR